MVDVRKLGLLCVSAVLFMAALPFAPCGAAGFQLDVEDGVLRGYSGDVPSELIIPDTVSFVSPGVFRDCGIEEVVFEGPVTVGPGAFAGCPVWKVRFSDSPVNLAPDSFDVMFADSRAMGDPGRLTGLFCAEEGSKIMHRYCEVTYDTSGAEEMEPQLVRYGQLPEAPADPVCDGRVFAGWVSDGEEYVFDAPLHGDVTVTAVWEDAHNTELLLTGTLILVVSLLAAVWFTRRK